jgi:hypothetical protein
MFESPSPLPPLVYKATSDGVAGEITGKPMNLDLSTVDPEETFKVFPDA